MQLHGDTNTRLFLSLAVAFHAICPTDKPLHPHLSDKLFQAGQCHAVDFSLAPNHINASTPFGYTPVAIRVVWPIDYKYHRLVHNSAVPDHNLNAQHVSIVRQFDRAINHVALLLLDHVQQGLDVSTSKTPALKSPKLRSA